eukprot:11220567-Lingulodinium_polyedra.AAC.1
MQIGLLSSLAFMCFQCMKATRRMRVVETGRIPTMRYLRRTRRVAVPWLHERFQDVASRLKMAYAESEH